VQSFTTSHTLITPIVSAVNRKTWGPPVVVSRYAAKHSIGRVCADIEPMGVGPSGDCAEDRSLSHRMLNGSTTRSITLWY
jgi:hypothetical protein